MFMHRVTDESEGAGAVAADATVHVRALIDEDGNEALGDMEQIEACDREVRQAKRELIRFGLDLQALRGN